MTDLEVLTSLREECVEPSDQVQLHYMHVLAERMVTQPETVRIILAGKLGEALARFQERRTLQSPVKLVEVTRHSDSFCAVKPASTDSLMELNRYIQNRSQESNEDGLTGEGNNSTDMKSVRQFRQTWSRISASEKVELALRQSPENAGPLNSHMLVTRTLSLMRDLSPAYLQRFLSQVDAMMSLDAARLKPASVAAKPVRRSRKRL